MKKEKWSLGRIALVFLVIAPIVQFPRLWEIYYPIYGLIGLSDRQVVRIISELVGTMIGGAGLGYIIAIVRNRFFR